MNRINILSGKGKRSIFELLRKLPVLIVVIVLVAACFCVFPIKKHAKENVQNNRNQANMQVDSDGLTATALYNDIKTGWNLGNSLDAYYGEPTGDANFSQETVWGQPKVTKQQIDYVASLGFNAIRIPVSWYYHSYRDENGNLIIHPDWLGRVKEVVDYAYSNNMYVFLDSHHDEKIIYVGAGANEFAKVSADVQSIWTQIATYFADYDNHLVFEAYNEVGDFEKCWIYNDFAAKQLNALNQVFVDTIRATGGKNAGRVLMVPTLLDGPGGKFLTSFELPNDTVSDRLLVTVHFYTQCYDQELDESFDKMEEFSQKTKTPVVIGEWGTTTSYKPAKYRVINASNFIARATEHNLKCIYWDNGSDFAIVDRTKLTAQMDIIDAIMNPQPYTSDGEIIGSKFSDYIYMTIDPDTGETKEDNFWGTLALDLNGSGYPIPDGAIGLSLCLKISGGMKNQAIHYLYFYDKNGKLIDGDHDWNGYTEKLVEIPVGAKNFRIGITSATTTTTKNMYVDGFVNGDIKPTIRFVY